MSPVTQISAQWKVPTILARSPKGSACTWIGAQLAGTAFIQLGTCEYYLPSTPPFYEAFWSDRALGFHAQFLGTELAGDSFSALMRQTKQGWILEFKNTDPLSHLKRTIKTSYGAGVHFDEAEWIQEDPGLSLNAPEYEPYPLMSSVAFHVLRLNMHPPQLSGQDRAALIAADGIFLVPTPVHGDAFTLATPHGPAAQFLRDLDSFILTSRPSQIQFGRLLESSHPTTASNMQPLITADENLVSQMSKQEWPRSARTAVQGLIRLSQSQPRILQQWKNSGLHNYGSAWSTLRNESTQLPTLLLNVCQALGLPLV
jgi:hypothetical protein